MKLTLLTALLLNCGSAMAFGSTPPAISQLHSSERLHIAYSSSGCFHQQKYEIDFERGGSVIARSSSGRVATLSAREISGLDRLIQFYRTRPGGGCTTQDNVTINYFRGGEKISTEHYVDGSCTAHEKKGVTRLDEIAKKLGVLRES